MSNDANLFTLVHHQALCLFSNKNLLSLSAHCLYLHCRYWACSKCFPWSSNRLCLQTCFKRSVLTMPNCICFRSALFGPVLTPFALQLWVWTCLRIRVSQQLPVQDTCSLYRSCSWRLAMHFETQGWQHKENCRRYLPLVIFLLKHLKELFLVAPFLVQP